MYTQEYANFTDYEDFVSLLMRQKIKIYSKKLIFCKKIPILPKGDNFALPINTDLEWLINVFNDFYYKSVSQTLILRQKTISFKQNR